MTVDPPGPDELADGVVTPVVSPTGLVGRSAGEIVGERTCAVVRRSASLVLATWQQTYTVEAKCESGEQLLGGGFANPDFTGNEAGVKPPRTKVYNLYAPGLTVMAGDPSSPTTWTVVFSNSDAPPSPHQTYKGYNHGLTLRADAYCLRTPVDARMGYASADDPRPADRVDRTVHTPALPPGSVVTGGGFRTTYATGVGPSYCYMGNLTESTPDLNPAGLATGWRVSRFGVPGPNYPTGTRAYVCYSSANLVAAKVRTVNLSGTQMGYGPYVGMTT